jgi:hypothetical protein
METFYPPCDNKKTTTKQGISCVRVGKLNTLLAYDLLQQISILSSKKKYY